MEIMINLLNKEVAKELFEFECDNRLFFEKMVPSRGEDYYKFEVFKIRHKELLIEQEKGISHFYIVRNNTGQITGRVNLVDIDKNKGTAHVGFRVGKQYVGKGIANQALKQLLKTESGVKKVHGKTTTNNIASQKTMEKNGFIKISISDEEIDMNGKKLKFIHYIWEQ